MLDAVARALQLDTAEREHLFNLVDLPVPRRATTRPSAARLRPAVQTILDSLPSPALVQNERLDVVGTNAVARALYAPLFAAEGAVPNTARFAFLHEEARDSYQEWDTATSNMAALLHAAAGRHPRDPGLVRLIGELTTGNPAFSRLWAQHDVLRYRVCPKRFLHPEVGDVIAPPRRRPSSTTEDADLSPPRTGPAILAVRWSDRGGSPVQLNPWGLVVMALIAAVVLLIRYSVRRATADDMPDHHEPGRRFRDMTPAGKVVAVVAAAALVGVVVGRALDPTPGWFWWCTLVVVAGAVFVGISEHRRVRRDPRLPEYRGADPVSRPAADR